MRWTRPQPYFYGRDSQDVLSSSLALLAVISSTLVRQRSHLYKTTPGPSNQLGYGLYYLNRSILSFCFSFFRTPWSRGEIQLQAGHMAPPKTKLCRHFPKEKREHWIICPGKAMNNDTYLHSSSLMYTQEAPGPSL